ncbi:MAG: hydroxysqualene dehydroxylase HpnE [Rickettsiales bacterium]|nr:hydroxysqualene dehydroxylase HpnE [Rickettsiales bacterium]
MTQGTVHIIGAGLAGLSAATQLADAGHHIVIYEASAQAGGRCRSYYDVTLDSIIDNGNHLVLAGNQAARTYLKRIGTDAQFSASTTPSFDYVDARTLQRWTLRLNEGLLPLWLFNPQRRVPDTKLRDYLAILRLLWAKSTDTIENLLPPHGLLYERLWHSFFVSALNTHPSIASASLAAAILRGSLMKGGKACVPLVAEGLSEIFIDPAIAYIKARGGDVLFNQRVRAVEFSDSRATALSMSSGETVTLHAGDHVICAATAPVACSLLPALDAPDEWRGIVNAHFRITPPAHMPKILGVIHAQTEWIFCFPDRISVTISDADRLMSMEREALAAMIWQEVSSITGLDSVLPPWQIIKEKRATFAATPQQDAKRPAQTTSWHNVYLAGDWVQTGLPSTIEGAILSGVRAAELVTTSQ